MTHDATQQPGPDIEQLRHDFPLWEISASWVTRQSEPDFLLIVACREGLRLGAFSLAEMRLVLADAEVRRGWPNR